METSEHLAINRVYALLTMARFILKNNEKSTQTAIENIEEAQKMLREEFYNEDRDMIRENVNLRPKSGEDARILTDILYDMPIGEELELQIVVVDNEGMLKVVNLWGSISLPHNPPNVI